MTTTDEELISQMAKGDRRALEILYRRHSPWMAGRLAGATSSRDLAEEALQVAFLAAWCSARSYTGTGEVAAWLWGIARRRLVSLSRKRTDVPEQLLGPDDPGVDEIVVSREEAARVRQAVANLPLDQRGDRGRGIRGPACRRCGSLPRDSHRNAKEPPTPRASTHQGGTGIELNDHPRELLPLIAEGALPDEDVRAHLNECLSCRAALTALSPLDLDYAWEGVAAELDAPHASVAERILTRAGMESSLARFVISTPSLRGSWLLASLLVVSFAFVGTLFGPELRVSPVLLVAPLVAAGLVAFAYGPAADPAHEIAASTPLSPLTALLLRVAAVLAWSSGVVGVANFAAGTEHGVLAWFLPMTCVALLAAAIGVRSQPVVGAAGGMGIWMAVVVGAMSAADDPARFLWGTPAQVVYAVAVAVFLTLLSKWVVDGRGLVGSPAFPGSSGGSRAG